MKKFLPIALLFFSLPILADEYPPQQGYSLAPLTTPVYDWAYVLADSVAFNNWLNVNYPKLSREEMKGPREHLYYLISSYVSEYYKQKKSILPKNHDLTLASLFSWSESLGVYGGSLVYNKVKDEKSSPMPMRMKVPTTLKLTLENDLYKLEALSNAWSITLPYYFMINHISDYKTINGMQTQVLSVSTGASRDKTKAGQSQGTILLVFSPSYDVEAFSKFWLKNLEIPTDAKITDLAIRNLHSQYSYDNSSLLHKEITLWQTEKGSIGVVYMGMDGTYQNNRQHFLDFLTQLKTQPLISTKESLEL